MVPDEPYKGLTLKELVREFGFRIGHGVCVKMLEKETDQNGQEIDECPSLGLFLKRHPEYCSAVVVRTTDFYNTEIVFVLAPTV